MVRRVLGRFLDLLSLGEVLVVGGRQRSRMGWEHVLQDVVEPVARFVAVLFEPIQPECPDGGRETEHRRVDPRRSGGDGLGGVVRRGSVSDFFDDAHDLVEADVPRVGDQDALLRIDHRFLQDADGLGLEETLAPLRHPVCFGQQTFAVELSILDLPADGVLREYVRAERIRVPVPEALGHLLPGIVERGAVFVILGHDTASGGRCPIRTEPPAT